MTELATYEIVYDPRAVEGEVYASWEQAAAFRCQPDGRPHQECFTIVMPPPNVTGALHLGHALNSTLQDILVRYHRMRGFNTLWQPGTDHAGIATQAVVERRIREAESKSRHDLGREELVRRIWQWKDEYERRIISQLKMMGCSCDWERTRFTLDEGLARAVRQQFFQMFKDGLIFRGVRLVNWDTELQTAVANDEVYYETIKGSFWHFKYPVIDPGPGEPEFVMIATTRPETMLADTAVAVNPDPAGALDRKERELTAALGSATEKERAELEDKTQILRERRTTHLPLLEKLAAMARDGRKVRLPLMERPIPLIADEWADPLLGTGCVKITPAHDPNDYEVGLRHKLPMINALAPDGKVTRIIEPDGSTNPYSASYEGLNFSTEGRAKVLSDLEARGLVDVVEDRDREIGHSDRSKTPIEPFLSDQWFVRTGGGGATEPPRRRRDKLRHEATKGLAQAAMDVVVQGRVRIFPERYAKTYLDWLGEKRDWCISRQLWWGHRIAVWHKRVTLTERNWPDHILSTGLDSLLPGRFKGNDDEACVVFQRVEDGTLADPNADLFPVVKSTEGEYDVYVCAVRDKDVTYLEPEGYQRDEDVLDTWFSAALWPFSTLGWPVDTPELRQHYPGTVLVTSRDIITNWVARMVMFGLYSMDQVPFDHVYVHPKILDGRGETMSKSKGNGVDPVDIIHTHGADALRYTMADMTTETQDIRMPVEYICPNCGRLTDQLLALKAEEQARKSRGQKLERRLQPADCTRVRCSHKECGREFATQWADAATKQSLGAARESSEKFEIGRNFCNKLWNAARFAFMNLKDAPCHPLQIADLLPEDRWILARLSQTIRDYHRLLQTYQFSASVKVLREFFWDSLCDWYIELTKPRLSSVGPVGQSVKSSAASSGGIARQVLAFCMDQVLRLLHPTIPFVTERLWTQLHAIAPRRGLPGIVDLNTAGQLVVAEFPPVTGYPALDDAAIVTTFAELQDATRGVRDLRASCGVSPKNKVTVTVVVPDAHVAAFRAHAHVVRHMAQIDQLFVESAARRPPNAASIAVHGLRIFVHDISDDVTERDRSAKSLDALRKQIAGKEAKLANDRFVTNADPALVAAERQNLAELLNQRSALQEHLDELGR